MGDNNDSVFEVDQEFLQPVDCIEIQVVGRLIEQQDIRITEKRSCKQHLDLIVAV